MRPWRHNAGTGVAMVFLLLASALPARAFYEPEKLTDTSRRWALGVNFLGQYDDNIFTSSTKRQGGYSGSASVVLRANIPREQTFFRMNYEFDANYTPRRTQDQIEQVHIFDALVSHTFSPRLVLNLNDSLRRAIEPSYVDVQSGQPIQFQRRGDYIFNDVNCDLSYELTQRWTAHLRGGWDIWRYDVSSIATNNDRDSYRGELEFNYSLSQRTVAGFGYQYSTDNYVNPGPVDSRNGESHLGFVSLSHQFNPQLVASLQGGMELHTFGDGTQDTSPNVSGTLNYSFRRDTTFTLGVRYSILATEVNAFRSTDTLTVYGGIDYRITQKFTASAHGIYALSAFNNPAPGTVFIGSIPRQEQDYQADLSLNYGFTRWIASTIRYSYTHVLSDYSDRSFFRNWIALGLNLNY